MGKVNSRSSHAYVADAATVTANDFIQSEDADNDLFRTIFNAGYSDLLLTSSHI